MQIKRCIEQKKVEIDLFFIHKKRDTVDQDGKMIEETFKRLSNIKQSVHVTVAKWVKNANQ